MTTTPSWPEYLRRITNNAPGADISRATGIPASTISRWLSGETKPSLEKIDILAKHYDFETAEALAVVAVFIPTRSGSGGGKAEGGAINHDSVSVALRTDLSREDLLRRFSDLELAEEFVRRIEQHDSVEAPQPLSYAEEISNVYEMFRDVRGSADDEELDGVARPRDPEPTDEQ